MKPPTRIAAFPFRLVSQLRRAAPRTPSSVTYRCRSISSSPNSSATVTPVCAVGPPPEPPSQPTTKLQEARARLERRRKQAEILKRATEGRASAGGKALRKRFWKDVSIKEVNGALQVYLDSRPLRHPDTKAIIHLPLSKPHLAAALALEWDLLESAQQATKQHLVPLTSLVCRALDLEADDAAHRRAANADGDSDLASPIRTQIAGSLLRYLDTDTLLCWAPQPDKDDPLVLRNEAGDSLHDVQARAAGEIGGFLAKHVWPGVVLRPALEEGNILPRPQDPEVRDVVRGWILGLSSWELTGFERAVLAGKSVLCAARLIMEWGEGFEALRGAIAAAERETVQWENLTRFGVEEAARAASIEVDWQTGRWGEVEDTHDVEKEDVRRQFGSVVLLIAGITK